MSISSASTPLVLTDLLKRTYQSAASIVKGQIGGRISGKHGMPRKDIIALGDQGWGRPPHYLRCLCMHIDENVLDGDRIDPHKIDLMGRMGRTFLIIEGASGNAVSSIYQPVTDLPVGFDALLPSYISSNRYLTGNQNSDDGWSECSATCWNICTYNKCTIGSRWSGNHWISLKITGW